MSVDEWDERVLCPDGACNGIIGPDGTCKVCGHVMPNWGDERQRGLLPVEDDEDVADEDDEEDEDDDTDDDADDDTDDESDEESDEESDDESDDDVAAASGDPEWTERKLCDDGACVGVVGREGTCNVCGKRSEAA